MASAAKWTMDVALEESGGITRAQVRLAAGEGSFTGIGLVRGGPRGVHLPEIAAELAIARAFSDLTEELLEAVASDIESHSHRPFATMTPR
ncbi:dsRBD fold-containing protein [Amycolatopsis sp.]|uniref:dsRBD fold-containing protein n=1 Tax=Amycolatopsis sp. TaxID=37632 RepID=UPI002C3AC63B|nr:dsRBD fold-containing protein [Amycolatopsis sp.]HVV14757.1 dsRBD fold-containing protein [Amycolatopsis sp.]